MLVQAHSVCMKHILVEISEEGFELIATDRKSHSIERWTNTLLVFVFSWVFLTVGEMQNNGSLVL